MSASLLKTTRLLSAAGWAAIPAALGARCVAASSFAATAPIKTTYHRHASATVEMKRETLERRISMLHEELKITPDQETDWAAVAQVMRANETAMQKLIAERKIVAPSGANALDDLMTYEKFNRAHVEGLKDLISSFGTLYNAMPESQKMIADHVFQKYHHRDPKFSA